MCPRQSKLWASFILFILQLVINSFSAFLHQECYLRGWEMAQQAKALADLSQIPRIHKKAGPATVVCVHKAQHS